jgi:hypothetical protein
MTASGDWDGHQLTTLPAGDHGCGKVAGMKLKTDFRDYYDHSFDGTGDTFVRVATDAGPDKREQFRIMKDAGFKTPPHGEMDDVLGTWWQEGTITTVVEYTDLLAHVGEGKELFSLTSLWEGCDTSRFCSAFVPGPRGVSWRRLQVGRHVFWIEYTSEMDWRSNCGEGDIELLESKLNAGYHPHIRLPLFAIDFVHRAKDMYAIDFNIAPGIRGSGVEKVLSSWDAVEAIETAVIRFDADPSA